MQKISHLAGMCPAGDVIGLLNRSPESSKIGVGRSGRGLGIGVRLGEVLMKKIAPSILSADFSRLGEEVRAVEEAGADVIHVDVMDGHFVPNITVGPPFVEGLRKLTSLPLDVHLMIEKPERFVESFAAAGSTWLTFHAEVCPRIRSLIKRIRELKVRPGLVLNPSTPLKAIYPFLEEVDLVLLMSVRPGFAGQSFISATLKKIERLRKIVDQNGWALEIEVDGGIKIDNIDEVSRAGGDIFVLGTGIFKTNDYAETIRQLREIITQGTNGPFMDG